jgi:hypothetical protein
MHDRGSVPSGGNEGILSVRHLVHSGSGSHPASYPMGTGGFFSGGKAAGSEADRSLPSSAEDKNERNYAFTPPKRLHGVVLS